MLTKLPLPKKKSSYEDRLKEILKLWYSLIDAIYLIRKTSYKMFARTKKFILNEFFSSLVQNYLKRKKNKRKKSKISIKR